MTYVQPLVVMTSGRFCEQETEMSFFSEVTCSLVYSHQSANPQHARRGLITHLTWETKESSQLERVWL